jgi:hypothetical protein
MRYMLIALLALSFGATTVACGGKTAPKTEKKDDKKADKKDDKKADPKVKPATSTVKPAAAAAKGGHAEAIKGFADAVCACKEMACIQAAQKVWGPKLKALGRPGPEVIKGIMPHMTRMQGCMKKALSIGKPKAAAAPATAKPVAVPATAKPVAVTATAKPVAVPATVKPAVVATTVKPAAVPATAKPAVANSGGSSCAKYKRCVQALVAKMPAAKAQYEQAWNGLEMMVKANPTAAEKACAMALKGMAANPMAPAACK